MSFVIHKTNKKFSPVLCYGYTIGDLGKAIGQKKKC